VGNARDAYEILQIHPSALPEVVEAAYRVLAMLHHPDRNANRDDGWMADLNWAYSVLHDPERRMAYDRERAAVAVPIAPPEPERERPSLRERIQRAAEEAVSGSETGNPAHAVIDFGRYAGMTLGQLVRVDPVYLEWLRRHSSGARYRHQIDAVLGAALSRRAAAVAEAAE
jgi:curved DNA-binding protein CbpA